MHSARLPGGLSTDIIRAKIMIFYGSSRIFAGKFLKKHSQFPISYPYL